MGDPAQIEKDIREYLEKEPNLRRDERLAYLMVIFQKHLGMTKLTHSVNYRDLGDITDGAKRTFTNFHLPLKVSDKKIEGQELVNMALIESFISYLNLHKLLTKQVKMDYR